MINLSIEAFIAICIGCIAAGVSLGIIISLVTRR